MKQAIKSVRPSIQWPLCRLREKQERKLVQDNSYLNFGDICNTPEMKEMELNKRDRTVIEKPNRGFLDRKLLLLKL